MRRMTSPNLHLEYTKGGLEWSKTRGRETTALDVIRIDKMWVGWSHRVAKVKRKRKTVVTLMPPPCITSDDFKIER